MLQTILNENDCYKILKNYDSSVDPIKILNYSIKEADGDTIGFLGAYFRLEIVYFRSEIQELTCFVKTEPILNESQKEFVQDSGLFKKEALIYNVLPKLMEMVGVNVAPRCFLAKNNLLVLEDLKCNNFRIIRRDYKFEECMAMVKTLANFHSSSIIFEERQVKKFELDYGEMFIEATMSFVENDPKYKWLKTATNCVTDFWKTLPGYNDDTLREKLLDFVFGGNAEKLIKPSRKFRNVMTQRFMAKYTPPAHDLLMALYLTSTREFLRENSEHILDFYYETFATNLRNSGLNPDEVFPRHSFFESLEIYRTSALVEASIFSTNVHLPQKKSSYILGNTERYQDYSFRCRSKYIMDTFENDPYYRGKLLGLIIPLADILREK